MLDCDKLPGPESREDEAATVATGIASVVDSEREDVEVEGPDESEAAASDSMPEVVEDDTSGPVEVVA